MTHTQAITLTTDQIKSWGLVGTAILFVAAMLIIGIAKSLVGRTIWVCIGLALLFFAWQQHDAIAQSIKGCDPHVLFVHLKISDPKQLATCQSMLNPH
jgi:hypothetical protein